MKNYYRIYERGFANEFSTVFVEVGDKHHSELLEKLTDWEMCSPSGSVDRIKARDLNSEDREYLMPITEFGFRFRVTNSDEEEAKRVFNHLSDFSR